MGFLSADGRYAHCSREDYAHDVPFAIGSQTYAHLLVGTCRCGAHHDGAITVPPLPANGHGAPDRLVCRYDYRDEAGTLLYQVERHEPKRFLQRRPDGQGGWVYKMADVRRVLYRLPELVARGGELVYLVEGEKDADALAALGLLATTNVGGAGKWRPEYGETLRGREVVILPDKDGPGREHAARLAAALAGIAVAVWTLELPGAGKDVSDWLGTGGSTQELERLLAALLPQRPRLVTHTLEELLATRFPPTVWAVDGLLPVGLTLFAGKPKTGKSLLMMQVGMGIAWGGFVLGTIAVQQGTVLYLDMENGEELLQERVIEALHGQRCPKDFHYATLAPRIDEALVESLDTWMDEHPETRLIVVDTFEAVRGVRKPNASVYGEDYAALRPVADWAKRRRVCVVALHHLSKGISDDVFSIISGSYGLTGAVDNLMAIYGEVGDITLRAKGRRVRDRKLSLAFDALTAQWVFTGEAELVQQSNERTAVIKVLRTVGSALYPREIADELGRKHGSGIRMLLSRMVEAGDLARDGQKYTVTEKQRNAPPCDGCDGVTLAPAARVNILEEASHPPLEKGEGVTLLAPGVTPEQDSQQVAENDQHRHTLSGGVTPPAGKFTLVEEPGVTPSHPSHPFAALPRGPCPTCHRHYAWKTVEGSAGAYRCGHCGTDYKPPGTAPPWEGSGAQESF